MIDDGPSDAELSAWLARLNSLNLAVDHFAECRRATEVVEALRRTRARLKAIEADQAATRQKLDRMCAAVAHAASHQARAKLDDVLTDAEIAYLSPNGAP
jgi:hypothetical protein